MIKLTGVLHIRIVSGRHGDFRVGRLVTDLGEFAVKDAELDQYEEGRYEGEFGVSQIFPASYSANGRMVVEVRAKLSLMALASMAEPEPADAGLEQDPLDEQPKAALNPLPQEESSRRHEGRAPVQTESDAELFGLLWPLANPVKLDATIDRNLFRNQRDRLKALGYRFQAIGQQWIKE